MNSTEKRLKVGGVGRIGRKLERERERDRDRERGIDREKREWKGD